MPNKKKPSNKSTRLNSNRGGGTARPVKTIAVYKPVPDRAFVPSAMNGKAMFAAVEDYILSRESGEFGYYLSLMDPERGVARYPTAIPVPTATRQFRGSFTIAAPSTGCVRVYMAPTNAGASAAIAYCNDATTTDATAGTYVTVLTGNALAPNAYLLRCTGAVLRYMPVASAQTATGWATAAYCPIPIPYSTADAIRDQDTAISFNILQAQSYAWRPLDYRDTALSTSAGSGSSVVYAFSGLTAGTPLTFQYCINIEFVPNEVSTDLFDTDVSHGKANETVVGNLSAKSVLTSGARAAKKFKQKIEEGIASGLGRKVTNADWLSVLTQGAQMFANSKSFDL